MTKSKPTLQDIRTAPPRSKLWHMTMPVISTAHLSLTMHHDFKQLIGRNSPDVAQYQTGFFVRIDPWARMKTRAAADPGEAAFIKLCKAIYKQAGEPEDRCVWVRFEADGQELDGFAVFPEEV